MDISRVVSYLRLFLVVEFTLSQVHYPDETRLANVRQLTFGGQNAEAYFSFDDQQLTFQATGNDPYGTGCDQIYRMDLRQPSTMPTRLSTGLGVCTCSFFFPDNSHVLYAGTFASIEKNLSSASLDTCPVKKCRSAAVNQDPTLEHLCNTSYTWDIYPEMDIFKVNAYGNLVQRLTNSPGYDAEATLSPDGKMIVFTSIRSGDLELWLMDVDGSNLRQLTNETGYDGGAFFSPDSQRLVFRASRPKTDEELKEYKALLNYSLVAPTKMELFVINVNGTGIRQITSLGGANWAPFFLPDGHRIIFSSDHNSTQGFDAFDLYVFDETTGQLEQITKDGAQFDSFPMFSYNGKQLVWASSRNGSEYDMNLFIADWVDTPSSASASASTATSTSASASTATSTSVSFPFRPSAVLIFCLFFLSMFY